MSRQTQNTWCSAYVTETLRSLWFRKWFSILVKVLLCHAHHSERFYHSEWQMSFTPMPGAYKLLTHSGGLRSKPFVHRMVNCRRCWMQILLVPNPEDKNIIIYKDIILSWIIFNLCNINIVRIGTEQRASPTWQMWSNCFPTAAEFRESRSVPLVHRLTPVLFDNRLFVVTLLYLP